MLRKSKAFIEVISHLNIEFTSGKKFTINTKKLIRNINLLAAFSSRVKAFIFSWIECKGFFLNFRTVKINKFAIPAEKIIKYSRQSIAKAKA
jgi:lipid-binding SYLF domain-containing protein